MASAIAPAVAIRDLMLGVDDVLEVLLEIELVVQIEFVVQIVALGLNV